MECICLLFALSVTSFEGALLGDLDGDDDNDDADDEDDDDDEGELGEL